MRLLDTSTLKLQEFHSNIPQYAILSNTWAEEDVAFEEIGRPEAEGKLGFQKDQTMLSAGMFSWLSVCLDRHLLY